MASRVLRILLMLGLAAAAGVAGWQVWQLEQLRAEQRTERARIDAISRRATRAMLDIRASQRAYLSPGQGIAFWKARVDQHLLTLRDGLQALKNGVRSATSPAIAADDAALDALDDVTRLERRIAEHVEAGRLEHAADLVYADNIGATLALDGAVDGALTAHRQELQAQQTDLRWREGGILALTALAGFLLAFLVKPSRAAITPDTGESAASDEGELGLAGIGHFAAAGQSATRPASLRDVDLRDAGIAAAADRRGLAAGQTPSPASKPAAAASATGKPAAAASTAGKPAAAASTAKPAAAVAMMTASARMPAAATSHGQAGAGAARGEATTAPPTRPDPSAAKTTAATASGSASGGAHRDAATAPGARRDLASAATGSGDLATPAAIARAAADAAATGTSSARSAATAIDDAPPVGSPTILAAAELSVSMARVGDAEGLQPLLARIATQLDAVGMIVWLQDSDGRTLKPALTHGYAAETLAHLRAIDRDADNATARAFRTGQPQKVASRDTTAAGPRPELGALVVPMETASGCVGVIAAELRHGREHDPATLALTRIVAAQLAMLTADNAG